MKSKYTQEERIKLIKEQQQSGFSIVEFCKDKNIKQTTFQNWLRRDKPKNTDNLVKVTPQKEISIEPTLLMVNNIKIEFPATVSTLMIAKIISVIREDI